MGRHLVSSTTRVALPADVATEEEGMSSCPRGISGGGAAPTGEKLVSGWRRPAIFISSDQRRCGGRRISTGRLCGETNREWPRRMPRRGRNNHRRMGGVQGG